MNSLHNATAGLYRARDGKFLGVCKGLARHFGIKAIWVRLGLFFAALFTGFWPVLGLYVIAALLMRLEPVLPVADDTAREFYDAYASSRAGAAQRIKDRVATLDRRLKRMEDVVTSKEFQWEQRLAQGDRR